jgi:hypothetical protein
MSRHPSGARAGIVATAPVLLLLAFAYHPYIARLTNDADVAMELTADETRWALSHLAVGIASGLLLIALLIVVGRLQEEGELTWSTMAAPFLVLGSTLFAFLPAMEIAALAAAEAGADVPAVLAELNTWFVPILIAGSLTFAIGIVLLALGIRHSGLLSRRATDLVVTALAVMVVARFVPLGAALYVGGVAGVVALWPLAHRMRPVPADDSVVVRDDERLRSHGRG